MKILFTKSQVENLLPQKTPFAMVETLLQEENELFSTLMITADNLLHLALCSQVSLRKQALWLLACAQASSPMRHGAQ